MANICAVLVTVISFIIEPILASFVPLTLLVTSSSFFQSPVSASLPKGENGAPRCFTTIESMHGNDETLEMIKSRVEEDMKKWGIEELLQYCYVLYGTRDRVEKCAKVIDIFKSSEPSVRAGSNSSHAPQFQTDGSDGQYTQHEYFLLIRYRSFDYKCVRSHFGDKKITANLDGYLEKLGKPQKNKIGDESGQKEELNKAFIENGWNEMVEYCTNKVNWKMIPACSIVLEITGHHLPDDPTEGGSARLLKSGSKVAGSSSGRMKSKSIWNLGRSSH